MRLPAGINKWGSAALGVVCLFLVANLVVQYRAMQPRRLQGSPGSAGASRVSEGKGASHANDDLARYDPAVHWDALKTLDSRPLPDEDRNPFDFVGGAPPPPPAQAPAALHLPPPPPPPPPLKAVGYNELPGGQKEAMVTFNQELDVVHEGDTVGIKYKIISISPSKVVVEDANTHEKLELPIPQ